MEIRYKAVSKDGPNRSLTTTLDRRGSNPLSQHSPQAQKTHYITADNQAIAWLSFYSLSIVDQYAKCLGSTACFNLGRNTRMNENCLTMDILWPVVDIIQCIGCAFDRNLRKYNDEQRHN